MDSIVHFLPIGAFPLMARCGVYVFDKVKNGKLIPIAVPHPVSSKIEAVTCKRCLNLAEK